MRGVHCSLLAYMFLSQRSIAHQLLYERGNDCCDSLYFYLLTNRETERNITEVLQDMTEMVLTTSQKGLTRKMTDKMEKGGDGGDRGFVSPKFYRFLGYYVICEESLQVVV